MKALEDGGDSEGVKRNSLFNELNYFHVCSSGLPPCIGYDIFEGIGAYDTQLLIRSWLKGKWFSKREIEKFNYAMKDIQDKPCLVSAKSEKLKGGAMQILNFVRLLPLMLADKMDSEKLNSDSWRCFLLLSEIIEIICSPETHR